MCFKLQTTYIPQSLLDTLEPKFFEGTDLKCFVETVFPAPKTMIGTKQVLNKYH